MEEQKNIELLLRKWLDGEATPAEIAELEQWEEFHTYKKIAETALLFTLPKPTSQQSYKQLQQNLASHKKRRSAIFKPLLKIAAVVAIIALAFGGYTYYFTTHNYATKTAQTKHIKLPDNSKVSLSVASVISYSRFNWKQNRNLTLEGEAFFEVEKGKKFTVETPLGNVSVLGTTFNVEQRDNFFEVTCYEGKVLVVTPQKTLHLVAGESFSLNNGNITTQKTNLNTPDWVNGYSSFSSIPITEVIKALERQYAIEIKIKNVTFGSDDLYTGTFVHDNLSSALQSIALAFNLTYQQNGHVVTLQKGE